ncbi:hypothetical protein DFH09DRAFT_1172024, partial [Mycena vulgaris]
MRLLYRSRLLALRGGVDASVLMCACNAADDGAVHSAARAPYHPTFDQGTLCMFVCAFCWSVSTGTAAPCVWSRFCRALSVICSTIPLRFATHINTHSVPQFPRLQFRVLVIIST